MHGGGVRWWEWPMRTSINLDSRSKTGRKHDDTYNTLKSSVELYLNLPKRKSNFFTEPLNVKLKGFTLPPLVEQNWTGQTKKNSSREKRSQREVGGMKTENVAEVGWSLILLSTSHQSILAAVPRSSLCVCRSRPRR
jgi:hypothetical protein